jgi:hypothetical protein
MGVFISPDGVYTNSKPIWSTTFTFSGGGTQTILSLEAGEAWIFSAVQVYYGGSDYRHGSVYYATRANTGGNIRASYLSDQMGNSSFATSGTSNVTYTAGGGNPYTTLYLLRIH